MLLMLSDVDKWVIYYKIKSFYFLFSTILIKYNKEFEQQKEEKNI
jgi:uncharacterized protein with von Willebrand factor type A (vWA) domain